MYLFSNVFKRLIGPVFQFTNNNKDTRIIFIFLSLLELLSIVSFVARTRFIFLVNIPRFTDVPSNRQVHVILAPNIVTGAKNSVRERHPRRINAWFTWFHAEPRRDRFEFRY